MGFEGHMKLTESDFEENQELRNHIKILLNSALGKFNQKSHHIANKFVTNAEEMEKLFQENGENIMGFNDLDENTCHVVVNSEGKMKTRRTNPTLLAFITAKSRILLHKNILKLVHSGFTPYYCDTDSILFAGERNKVSPLKFGLAFGDFKNELRESAKIQEFHAYGRKNFFIRYYDTNSNKEKRLAKVCGMTLASKLAHDELHQKAKEKTPSFTQVRNIFESPFSMSIPKIQAIQHNNIEIRCERKVLNADEIQRTLPWGYNKD